MNFFIRHVQIFYENLKPIKTLQDLKKYFQNSKDFICSHTGTNKILYDSYKNLLL